MDPEEWAARVDVSSERWARLVEEIPLDTWRNAVTAKAGRPVSRRGPRWWRRCVFRVNQAIDRWYLALFGR